MHKKVLKQQIWFDLFLYISASRLLFNYVVTSFEFCQLHSYRVHGSFLLFELQP